MVFRRRAVVFRWRGVVGGICPAQGRSLGEGLPTRRTSERICPAQERSPRQRPPDTAHERKDLPPRRNALLGEGLPKRRTSERICPAQKRSPRRRPPDTAHERKGLPRGGSHSLRGATNGGPPPTDEQPEKHPFGGVAPETAHERKDLPRAGTLPSAKASRHGARAKGFAPRENALLGEGLPTRRTSERICPARERSPRRRPPDTAHERKVCPAGVRVRPTCRRTAGRPRPTNSRKNTPSAGSHPRRRGRCRVHSPKKNKTTP